MISDAARPFYEVMVDDLLKFYLAQGQFLSDNALFTEVCLKFGDRLLREVCPNIPGYGEIGECAVGAIEVMREAAERLTHPMVTDG